MFARRSEHLSRYLARPPIATDRLKELPDGNLLLAFKKAFSDGTTGVLFTPSELIAKLIPLIPRPRTHVVRFHGVLAPASGLRAQVVPKPAAADPVAETSPIAPAVPTRTPWALLMKRVFLIDVLDCPTCHGRMKVLAVVTKPGSIERILGHLGLPTTAPRASPARPPPQLDLDIDATANEFEPDPPAPDEAA